MSKKWSTGTTRAKPLVERVLTAEEQKQLTPDVISASFKAGNERFINNDLTLRVHSGQVRNAALGRFPKAVVLSWLGGRRPSMATSLWAFPGLSYSDFSGWPPIPTSSLDRWTRRPRSAQSRVGCLLRAHASCTRRTSTGTFSGRFSPRRALRPTWSLTPTWRRSRSVTGPSSHPAIMTSLGFGDSAGRTRWGDRLLRSTKAKGLAPNADLT